MSAATSISVGLFGYYGHFNFGDDLMALLFDHAIKKCDAECVVYSPREYLDWHLTTTTARSVEELVAKSELVVYGGGGALIPQPPDHPFSQAIAHLIDACIEQAIPLLCLSIGGSGIALDQVTPASRRRLVQQASYVSLRNRREWELYRQAGVEVDFFEDVVWLTSKTFPWCSPSSQSKRGRIAVNLYPSPELHPQLDRIFAVIGSLSNSTEWVFVETHTFPSEYWQAFVPATRANRFSTIQFGNVADGLRKLAEFDLVITNRLHVGIAAMSYGIPSLALFPVPKTRVCYEQLGLASMCWDETACERLVELDVDELRQQMVASAGKPNVKKLQASAIHHMNQLELHLGRARDA